MPQDTSIFNSDPYYDDYSDDKKFLRILYKPGYAVQARELTQTQTIAQTQIQRFGDNIFKDGSIVTESQVVLNQAKFVRVTGLTGYSGVSYSDFYGLTGTVANKNTIKILDAIGSLSGSNADTSSIFVFSQFLSGATGFTSGDVINAVYNGTTIYATVTGNNTYDSYASYSSLPAFGSASLIGLDSGVRYIKGFFVNHDAQRITPYNVTGSGSNTYRVFNNLNSTIKLDVTDTIVTATDDTSLGDPAYGSYNYNSPGADRYRIDLELNHVPFSPTASYTLINIEGGEATYKVNYPEYNVLADTLARRTYDESGNYTIDEFPISVSEHDSDETKLNVVIGKGKAYIFGYEFVNFANKTLTVNKARTLKTTSTQDTPTVVGNEVRLQFNTSLTANVLPYVDFNANPKFIISSGTTGPCLDIGSVRIGRLNVVSGTNTANIYDFSLTGGYTTGAAYRLFYTGFTASNQHVFTFTDNPPTITNPNFNSLLYPLSNDITSYAVLGVNRQQYIVQKSVAKTLAAGVNTINTSDFGAAFASGTWHEFNSVNDVKLFSPTGSVITVGTPAFGANNRIITFTPGSTGDATVFVNININDLGSPLNFYRTKTSATGMTSVVLRTNTTEQFAYLAGDVDVYQIISITGQIGAGSPQSMTTYFNLDSGQLDHMYDWSRIVLKNEYYGTGVTGLSVTYKKYNRSGTDGPFVMDSYGSTGGIGISGYKEIPVYNFKGRAGKSVSLAGCFDFRPDRNKPTVLAVTDIPANYGMTGSIAQLNDVVIQSTWNYYLPRTDKLVLNKDKQFTIVTGVETEQAPAPTDSEDAMTLGTIFLNPFTKTSNDTSKFLTKNRRYTMKDIGGIDKRVERLEYYTTLSLAEKDAKNLEIQDANGLNRFKNGIFVDSFSSRSNGNYVNPDHLCAVDPEKREVRPRFNTKYVDFSLTGGVPAGLTMSSDGIITFTYDTEAFITQPLASKAVNVNPFNVVNFNGSVVLSPSSDDWIDTTVRPSVVVNLDGQNDGIADGQEVDFGTVWNNWENNWTGRTIGTTEWNFDGKLTAPLHSVYDPATGFWRTQGEFERYAIQETSRFRNGENIKVSPETVSRNIGDRVVDMSIVPYIRASTLTITANGMRPNVRVYPFFDGTDVSSYVTVAGVTGGTITTDSEGRVGVASTVTFAIPGGTFRTGERLFRLIDSSTNTVANCTTSADQIYRAQGILKTEEGTIVSTRNLNIRRESVRQEDIFNNVVTEHIIDWIDPVAQSIFIDPIIYPSGLFVKKVSLYFKSKSSSLPVTLQIRPTVNGYPSSSTIIPFSEVYKSASDVNISDTGATATDFTFTTPVYLQPGEYALTILSNSNDYEVWVSEIGQPDVISEELISSQPYGGSFFKSQNSSTWTAEQNLDLKFVVHKCLFNYTSGSASKVSFAFAETNYNSGSSIITNGANVFKLNSTYITPANTGIAQTIQFESGGVLGSETTIQNNQNYTFSAKKSISDSNTNEIKVNYTLSTTETTPTDITPILDTDRISGLYIQNLVNYFNNDTKKEQYESRSSVRGITDSSNLSITRYITKKVNLQQGFESTNTDVYLSARLPLNADLRVYLKSQSPTDNTLFDNIPYEPLTIHPNYAIAYGSATGSSRYVSGSDADYVDLRFTRGGTGVNNTSGITGQTEFKSFQVKVVLYGDASNSVVPAFKDLKVLAT